MVGKDSSTPEKQIGKQKTNRKIFPHFTIGVRFISFVVLAALLAGSTVGFMAINTSRDYLRQEVLHNNLVQADLAAEFASNYIKVIQANVRSFASRPTVRQAVLNSTPEQVQTELTQFVQTLIVLDGSGILDAKGNQQVNSLGTATGQSFADRDYFQQAVATGQPYLGSPVKSRLTGRATTPYAVPIFDDQGQLRGILTGGISLDSLSDALVKINYGSDTSASLIDTRNGGLRIADINPESLLSPVTGQEEVLRLLLAGEQGNIENVASSGEKDLIGFASVPDLPWGVMVVTPSKSALAIIDSLTITASLFTGLAILLAAIVGVVLMLGVTRPIRKLAEATVAIGKGNLDYKVDITGRTEIGDLARSFSRMAQQLKQTLVSRDEMAEEVAERRKAEEALLKSEEKYRGLFENSQVGMYRSRLDGSAILDVNNKLCEIFGYSREEMLTNPATIRWADPTARQEMVKQIREKGVLTDYEMDVVTQNGEIKTCLISVKLFLKEGYIEGSAIDITGRKQAEKKLGEYREHLEELVKERTSELEKANNGLKEEIAEHKKDEEALKSSEEKYRNLVDNIPVGVSVSTTDGEAVERNKAFMAMFGFESKEEALRTPSQATYFDPNDRLRMLELLKKGKVSNFELQRRRRDGTTLWVSMTAIPAPGDLENQLITVTQDISERKKAEEALARQASELEMANIELSAVNKELEAFSYSVSHDLRAPLRSIDGFSQILLDEYGEKFDGESKDYLMRVRLASQRMGILIDDVLGLSRVTRSEMHIVTVDLSALAATIVNELSQRQPDRHVDVVIEPGLSAEGDLNLLRIMLTNLLSNAWKFTGKHSKAKVEFGKTIRDGKDVFFVRDDGAGFEMAYANKLFQPFQRLHGLNEFEGTGIGLATAQRVINRHGGRVWAEGAVGKGATFYFSI